MSHSPKFQTKNYLCHSQAVERAVIVTKKRLVLLKKTEKGALKIQ
jgi:hypothetical protein